MGALSAEITHSAVMPEVIVEQDDRILLVRGQEAGRVFWWPPGAYWIEAGTCDLNTTDPVTWVGATLKTQLNVNVTKASLRGVSLIDARHSPVLIYSATVIGEIAPNKDLGFDRAEFFSVADFPQAIGRDEKHGAWLRGLIDNYIVRA